MLSLLTAKSRLSRGNVPITDLILPRLRNITPKLFWRETLHDLKLLLKMIDSDFSFFLSSGETKLNGKGTYSLFNVISSSRLHYKTRTEDKNSKPEYLTLHIPMTIASNT